MKIINTTTTVVILFALFLTSCAGGPRKHTTPFSVRPGYNGQAGAATGAAGGALLGQAISHNTEGTLIGMAIGAILGYMIGNEMDKYDKEQLSNVYERGVSGQTSAWINPDYGQRMATPQPAYNGPQGQPCRNAILSAMIDGVWKKVNQTACRDPYGHWQLQKQPREDCSRRYTKKDRAECRARQ
jgi:surface antigen